VALVMELRVVPSANDVHGVCNPLADQVRSAINQEHSIGITQIVFLQTKTVPKTTSGKIARAWCRKAFVGETLKVIFRKSFKDETATFEIGESSKAARATPLSEEDIQVLRNLSKDEIKDKLRVDVAKIGQIPPDCIDDDTALITVLDSLSLSQFKGSLESGYSVQISDEYLFGETTTLSKLAEVVKLGHAPDDTGMSDPNRPPSTAMASPGNAGGLAGALGCPPGVVCCVVQ
jgi:acyl carrier protein